MTGVKPNWPRLNSFCLIAGIKIGSKKSIWIFKLNLMMERIMMGKIEYIVFGMFLLTTQQLVPQVVSGTMTADKRDVSNKRAKNHLKANEKVEKPNVIIVLTDDQGYGDFSVHGIPF